DSPVVTVGDLMTGDIRDRATGASVGRFDLPESDVIVMTLEDQSKVIARPSGTEPKIKFYIMVRQPAGADGSIDAVNRAAEARVMQIEESINAILPTLQK